MSTTFETLYKTNVNEHVEKKGGYTYLSWPYAVAQLRLVDPEAKWEVKRFDNLPYCKTEAGYFVEVAVTVQGVTLSQIHPVLDGKNRPIFEPSAFDINTSIQRCLVKAIALQGLGLYIYAGEDLPAGDVATLEPVKAKKLSLEQIAKIEALIGEVRANPQRILAYFKVCALAEIPAVEYERVVRSLQNRRRSAA